VNGREVVWMLGCGLAGAVASVLLTWLAPLTVIEASLAGGGLTVAGLITGTVIGMRREGIS